MVYLFQFFQLKKIVRLESKMEVEVEEEGVVVRLIIWSQTHLEYLVGAPPLTFTSDSIRVHPMPTQQGVRHFPLSIRPLKGYLLWRLRTTPGGKNCVEVPALAFSSIARRGG